MMCPQITGHPLFQVESQGCRRGRSIPTLDLPQRKLYTSKRMGNFMKFGLSSEIEEIRFDLIAWKMRDSQECTLSDEEVEIAIGEYKRFLELKIDNPDLNFAPTYLMDEVWHFHILDTKRYSMNCHNMFGKFLHHAPSYGPYDEPTKEKGLLLSFERMKSLYRKRYGHDPITRIGSCSSACSGVDDFGRNPRCGSCADD